MERLIELRPQYTLAVSLHAARSELRDVLVPLNRRYPVADSWTPRPVRGGDGPSHHLRVVMIDGINDTPADALALADLLRGQPRPRQPDPDESGRPHAVAARTTDRIDEFAASLRNGGIGTTVRRNRGIEIGAACGQLAADSGWRAGARMPSPAPASGTCSSAAAQRR